MKGELTQAEVAKKITELLAKKGVSRGVWSIKRSTLNLLVRGRVIEFLIPRRPTYDNTQVLLRDIGGAVDEIVHAKKLRQQIDLEEAIAAAP